MPETQDSIRKQVTENPIVLYMKGTPDFPQCGFSGRVVQILKSLEKPFVAVDVLSSPEIRAGIKTYSNWPTIPQLYVNGEFVGGCDIMIEMHASGELAKLVESVSA
jgi:monothiol glutaredoxin